jgi:hypothetical protein
MPAFGIVSGSQEDLGIIFRVIGGYLKVGTSFLKEGSRKDFQNYLSVSIEESKIILKAEF